MTNHNFILDSRNSESIIDEIASLIPYYVPEWIPAYDKDDLGVGLCKAYANTVETVIKKLNNVPQRNFIEFLNILGITLTPRQAARVPVTMTLSKEVTKNILVPSGTEIIAEASPLHDALTFITESDLTVTSAQLTKVYSISRDYSGLDIQIFDHTSAIMEKRPFSFFSGNNLQQHLFYIRHDDLLGLENNYIKIFFTSANSSSDTNDSPNHSLATIFSDPAVIKWEYNWQVDPDTGKEISNSAKQMHFYKDEDNSIILQKIINDKIKESVVNGINGRWIRCRLESLPNDLQDFISSNSNSYQAFLAALNCPPISGLGISIPVYDKSDKKSPYGESVEPDMIFCGETPLIKDSFYPFGKFSNISNIFYISSSTMLSKKGLSIEIELNYSSDSTFDTNNESNTQYDTIDILWEYWNGNGWTLIDQVQSTRFPKKWVLSFKCPQDITISIVYGHPNYWIRGRIAPSFFENKLKVLQKDNTFEIDPGTTYLPKITGISLLVSEKNSEHVYPPNFCICYNNLEYETCLDLKNPNYKPFRPFNTKDIDFPSVFLGFDKKIDSGGPVNLFCIISKNPSAKNSKADNTFSSFKYYSSSIDDSWKKIDYLDKTNDLTKTGYLQLMLPSDFTQRKIFNDTLHWVAAKNESDIMYDKNIYALSGIFLNTVEALHATKISEILGSSDYSPNQRFKLKNLPISDNPIKLWINESSFVSDDEKKILIKENKIQQESKNKFSDQLWVAWDEVEDLYMSDSLARHFTVDRESGTVQFGDGIHGKIPPAITDNIKVEYLTGGGKTGNVMTGEISSMKGSVPFVKSIFNLIDAGGGGNSESVISVMRRGPQIIKHRGQAVTSEDFEWVIREKFTSLAKVKCLSNIDSGGNFKPGHVSIVLVHTSSSHVPIPSSKLLMEVSDYVKKVSSITISENISVIGPTIAHVSVNATIYPYDINSASETQTIAIQQITEFLDPLNGGFDGNGWGFGQMISISDIYKLFESIHLVDHTDKVTLVIDIKSNPEKTFVMTTDNDLNSFDIDPKLLICNGSHSINLKWEEVH